MNRQRTAGLMLLLVLGTGLLSAQTPPAGDRPSPPTRRILILYDQDRSSPTALYVNDGIQESLRGSKYRIEVYREFFDFQQFSGEAEQKLIRDFLIRKYRDHRPDVIITVGVPPLQFVAEEHQHGFAGIPVVYCFSSGAEKDLKPDPEITGVTVAVDAASTLRAALQMLPHTRHVFVITGTAPYDLAQIQQVKKQLEDFSSRVDITYLAGLAMPELLKRLNGLPTDSIVLFSTHSRDGAGTYFDYQQNGSLISSAANVPVFTLMDVQIGYGQVGGDLAKTKAVGTIAGSEALKILDGVSPSQIPVAKAPNGFVFDWRALKRWGISESDLPPGSTILNRPISPWQLYKWYILGGLFLIALEALLIFGLLLLRARARRAEARLRFSQKRLAGLIETALDAIIAVDEEQRIVLFNTAAERIFGCSAASAIGSSLDRFVPQRFRAAHSAHIRRFGETGKSSRVMGALDTLSGLRSTGEEFPIEASISQVETSGKKLYTVILRDITERQRAAEELQREKAFTEAVIDSLPDIFFVIRTTGAFLHWGRNPERILGYSSEETEAMSQAVEIVAEEDRPLATHAIEEAFASGSVKAEVHLLHRDGRKIPYLLRATRALIGSEYLMVGIGLDITERKQTEEALMQSEERFRAMFESAAMGCSLVDLEGRFLQSNLALQNILGYSGTELLGMTISQCTHPDDRERDEKLFRELSEGRQTSYETEKRYIRKDGRVVWAHTTGSLLTDAHGKPQFAVGMIQDITQRKQLEQQFLQAQKMDAVGRLAGGVAHDFNNILGIITGYTELTLDDPTLAERPRERLAEIRNAANRAVAITRQLLTFSRKQVLETRILNLNEVVQETTRMLGRLLGEDIEIALVLDPNLGAVSADPTGIDQIILNLAVNARDAMPNGGKLTIETANATFDADSATRHGKLTAGDYVVLAVSDTGVGMDAATQEHIFEPFYTTKEKGRGTGLGLSTVLGIVEQSGGSIWTYSEVGCGTTFKIYLPRAAAAGPNVTSETPEVIHRGGETILLVEDDPGVRKLNVELLRNLGYNVIEAGDGAEALRIIERYPDQLHLLLTDVIMPGMNGYKLAELLSESRPELRVLFVSGYTETAVARQIADSGAMFLQKPFARNTLAAKLREALDAPARGKMEEKHPTQFADEKGASHA